MWVGRFGDVSVCGVGIWGEFVVRRRSWRGSGVCGLGVGGSDFGCGCRVVVGLGGFCVELKLGFGVVFL